MTGERKPNTNTAQSLRKRLADIGEAGHELREKLKTAMAERDAAGAALKKAKTDLEAERARARTLKAKLEEANTILENVRAERDKAVNDLKTDKRDWLLENNKAIAVLDAQIEDLKNQLFLQRSK